MKLWIRIWFISILTGAFLFSCVDDACAFTPPNMQNYLDHHQSTATHQLFVAPIHRWYLGAEVGEGLPLKPENELIRAFVRDVKPDIYHYLRRNYHPVVILNGGYIWRNCTATFFPGLSLGVSLQYATADTQHGIIKQRSLENNLTFSYRTDHTTLLALITADLIQVDRVSLFASAGLGPSYNHAYNYRQQATARILPGLITGYNSRSQVEVGYGIGGGLRVCITQNLDLILRYEYTCSGRVDLEAPRAYVPGLGQRMRETYLTAGLQTYL